MTRDFEVPKIQEVDPKSETGSYRIGAIGGMCFFAITAGGGRVLDSHHQAVLALLGVFLVSLQEWRSGHAQKRRARWGDYRNAVILMGAAGLTIGVLYGWLLDWLFP